MILSISAGGMVLCYCKKKLKRLVASPISKKRRKTLVCKREIHVLRTVICMEIGFTVTLGRFLLLILTYDTVQ